IGGRAPKNPGAGLSISRCRPLDDPPSHVPDVEACRILRTASGIKRAKRVGALALVSAASDLDAPLLCTYLRAPHNLFYPQRAKSRGGARGNRISVVHGTYTLPEPLRALGVDLEGRVAWARVVALNIGGSNPYCWASSIKSLPLEVRESADHGILVSKGMDGV